MCLCVVWWSTSVRGRSPCVQFVKTQTSCTRLRRADRLTTDIRRRRKQQSEISPCCSLHPSIHPSTRPASHHPSSFSRSLLWRAGRFDDGPSQRLFRSPFVVDVLRLFRFLGSCFFSRQIGFSLPVAWPSDRVAAGAGPPFAACLPVYRQPVQPSSWTSEKLILSFGEAWTGDDVAAMLKWRHCWPPRHAPRVMANSWAMQLSGHRNSSMQIVQALFYLLIRQSNRQDTKQ